MLLRCDTIPPENQRSSAHYLITWEKSYQPQSWPPAGGIRGADGARAGAQPGRGPPLLSICRPGIGLRQIVVQATNPSGRVIQVRF